jgi:hypothetical protein
MYFNKKGITSQINRIIPKATEVFLSKFAFNLLIQFFHFLISEFPILMPFSPSRFETLINILFVFVTERQLSLSQLSEYLSKIHFLDK